MAQWLSIRLPHRPPTNVARIRRHMWVEFVVGSRLPAPRVFLWVLRFSSLHKNQHFQIPIRPGNRTPLITVLCTEGLSCINMIYLFKPSGWAALACSAIQFSPLRFPTYLHCKTVIERRGMANRNVN